MQRFRIGDAVITKIPELDLDEVPPDFLFPGAEQRAVTPATGGLSAGSFNVATGTLRQSIHTWLVQRGGRTILIDTASGNDKERPTMPVLNHLDQPFIDRLAAAGVSPHEVDAVLMTHVHADHVGWNTRLQDGTWVPTFPNAQHYMSGLEANYGRAVDTGDEAVAGAIRERTGLGVMSHLPAAGVYTDSIRPIEEAGLTRPIVVDGSEAIPGFRYISLPGHSVDHAAILLEAGDGRALFWGDVLHHPVQVVEPAWNSVFCEFPDAAVRSQRQALALAAEVQATVFTTHFAESSAGRVYRVGDAYRWTFIEGDQA